VSSGFLVEVPPTHLVFGVYPRPKSLKLGRSLREDFMEMKVLGTAARRKVWGRSYSFGTQVSHVGEDNGV
jgi:hypothetical protein